MKSKVSVVIPAYNESSRIKNTVESVFSIPEVGEIIVVDDGSADNTADAAREAGARVYSLPVNMGKGGALNFGVPKAQYDVVALLDADLEDTGAEARLLMLPVLAKEADMTIARFPPPRKKGGLGLVKGLAAGVIKMTTGLEMQSPLSGQRVMTRKVIDRMLPFAPGYGVELLLTIKAGRENFTIREVPVKMYHAETGRNLKGFIHRGKQFVHILKVITKLKLQKA